MEKTLEEVKERVKEIVAEVAVPYQFELTDKLPALYEKLEEQLFNEFGESVRHYRYDNDVAGGDILIRNEDYGEVINNEDGTVKEFTVLEWGFQYQ